MGTSLVPTRGGGTAPARERIVGAGAHLFYANGIHATGVDALIEEANVAKSTFYRHFRSKDELIVAWLRSPRARWIDVVTTTLVEENLPPQRVFVDFWERLGDWAEREGYLGCPYLKALAEIEDPSHPARLEIEAFIHEVDDFFTHAAAACDFERPREIGLRLRLLTMGALTAIVVERSREPLNRARDVTVDFLASWQGMTRSQMQRFIASSPPDA
jgi:AcrR family transcriptional regulator